MIDVSAGFVKIYRLKSLYVRRLSRRLVAKLDRDLFRNSSGTSDNQLFVYDCRSIFQRLDHFTGQFRIGI
jgi:hypothetical protein